MPTKYYSKTSENHKTPQENANNHDNIKVAELLSRIASLKNTVDAFKSEFPIVKNVNTKLSMKLDDLHHYQRSACILVDDINLREEES